MAAPSESPHWLGRAALLLLLCAVSPALFADSFTDPASVLIVANEAVPESLTVARQYAEYRSIPRRNILTVDTLPGERISRQGFREQIRNPLLQQLVDRDFLNGMERDPDSFGRDRFTLFSQPDFRYMVLCYGVPARITSEKNPEFDDSSLRRKAFARNQQLLQAFAKKPLNRNEASVDTELALLLEPDLPFSGFVPNPLFQQKNRSASADVIRVTRLDGPSSEAVLAMVRNGIAAEQTGLRGRAYVDEDGRRGNYAMGNQWLSQTAKLFRKLAFDLSHDTARPTFSADHRFDAPVLYAGWYDRSVKGPFTLPDFRFPKGAVAAHLHSYSASPLRSPSKGWVGPLVDRGVSATFGNVAEPYLRYTHHFHLFFAALAEGWTFGDAAYFALPVLSWQGVAVGDPLYRPFATRLPDQLQNTDDPASVLENQYVVLREINRIAAAGETEKALRLASKGMRQTPGPALALRRAQLLHAHEQPEKARKAVDFFTRLDPADSSQWGLYAAMADFLTGLKAPKPALRFYRQILAQDPPPPVRKAFLKRAIPVADKAGKPGLANEWQVIVNPPPPPSDP